MKEFNIKLPKWPAMLVSGQKVSKVKAAEIIIRTGGVHYSSNDHLFLGELYSALFDIPLKSIPTKGHITLFDIFKDEEYHSKIKKICDKYGILDVFYLQNQQIVSSSINGPHGWINWNGDVFTNSYNIGKWPTVKDVYNEWKIIAEAFPYLNLKCQLLDKEITDNGNALVQFNVKDENVKVFEPKVKLFATSSNINFFTRFTSAYGERGCTIEQYKEALAITLKNISKY